MSQSVILYIFVTGLNLKEQPYPFVNDFKPVFPRNDSSSHLNMATASSSKIETENARICDTLPHSFSIHSGKQVGNHSGMDSSGDSRIRNGKARGDARRRNDLLTRYRPQITDKELQQISSEYPMVVSGFMIFICLSMIMIKKYFLELLFFLMTPS